MTPERFRALFPALKDTAWLDTPGAPPAAAPVADALRATVDAWTSGEFDWLDWDGAAASTREPFARLTGAGPETGPETVATMGSLSEAAATVARSLPRCRVVVPAEEFRSNLFPWLAHHDVTQVPARAGVTRVEDLVAAVRTGADLLAVSEVTTREGQRLDLAALRAATDEVGARLFVNLTQSLGALRFDPGVRPDYLAVHGYKWLLCPRGAAWLVARPDRVPELEPLAPSWKSTAAPHGYFGGPMRLDSVDTSPAWFSWIGARAALRLLGDLDPVAVERHCLGLAARFTERARDLGFSRVGDGPPAHIVVLAVRDADRVAAALAERRVRATALAGRVRFGFHYFNDDADVDRAIDALSVRYRTGGVR
ncbi:aminotransferase class V-fold PLP-dependent enzyme [Pseudonocardia acaciae]|uniref:aminotransferase class V-fold PLP-dependent enzyme n=1 Tax=Pseudonocardia acaciae TaxID=551276 RepID=UPI00048CE434|nr:aminotransferase class V-fold PLP-dependent enzyme [Pseudonocardia acaciae]